MYLVDFKALITQLLPPTWRKMWQEEVLRALFAPIISLHEHLLAFRKSTQEDIKINAQVKTLEHHLNRITNSHSNTIYMTDGQNELSVNVLIPDSFTREEREKVKNL